MSSRIERDFPAALKTPDGRVVEYGTAQASIQEGSVDFKSEFVPLFKMGTPLVIVRMKDKVETQVFTGESYLSTEKMLRLVAVRDEVLPGAASAYSYEVELSGQASALIQPKIQKREEELSALCQKAGEEGQRLLDAAKGRSEVETLPEDYREIYRLGQEIRTVLSRFPESEVQALLRLRLEQEQMLKRIKAANQGSAAKASRFYSAGSSTGGGSRLGRA